MPPILSEIKSINRLLEKTANNFEWDEVKVLTIKRHGFLKEHFDKNRNTDEQLGLKLFQLIQESDHKIKQLINQQKQLSIQSSLNLKKSFSAAKEYRITNNASND
jgi:hypothetical protein